MREDRLVAVVREDEKRAVQLAAEQSGLNVSAYVRHVLRADCARLGCWPTREEQAAQEQKAAQG